MMSTFHFKWSLVALKALVVSTIILLGGASFGQPRLVIHNDAYVRIDNAAWVVVANPATNAITTSGSGGNIRSEGEFNRVRWQIRNDVGSYTIPFTNMNGVKMPVTYTVLTAGSNDPNASIVFSTYNYEAWGISPGAAWNNDGYRPSDVTHMNSYNAPSVANSQNAVDRFWIVDPSNGPYAYTSKPSVELGFSYVNSTVLGDVMPSNVITSSDPVGAQRFNNSAGVWGDFLPVGMWAGGALGSVVNATVPASDFYRSWTLASLMEPLPVELLSFTAECQGTDVILAWTTATERNSDHFQLERSFDGHSFVSLERVQAAGLSQSNREYRFVDKEAHSIAYYRLSQVDLDGQAGTNQVVVVVECKRRGGGLEIVNAWDNGSELSVVLHGTEGTQPLVQLLDGRGRVIQQDAVTLGRGLTQISMPKRTMAQGVYLVRVQSAEGSDSRRLTLVF